MATQNEIIAGSDALKRCVDQILEGQGKGWEEFWIPESAYTTGSSAVIGAADGAKDQSTAGRQAAGVVALETALNAAGEGDQVTAEQCSVGAAAILAAVAIIRKGLS